MRVLAPAGLAGRLDALFGMPGFTAESLDVEAHVEGSAVVGGFGLEVAHVTHTESSVAVRVTTLVDGRPSGTGLVYSGDCGRTEDLDPLIRPGDTLLCEVSFGAGPVPPGVRHLDGPAVGELARRARAGRVLLTHVLMGFDRAQTIESVQARYAGPVELVDPGFETTVGS